MSKLSKIIKTTLKEAIIVIINCPIVSSLHERISANGLLSLMHVFFTIIKFYNNKMYPCLPIRFPAHVFFTIMKFTIMKCNPSTVKFKTIGHRNINAGTTLLLKTIIN